MGIPFRANFAYNLEKQIKTTYDEYEKQIMISVSKVSFAIFRQHIAVGRTIRPYMHYEKVQRVTFDALTHYDG